MTATATANLPVPVPGSAGPTTEEPYKFLNYFEERDNLSFAGRDRDIRECLERITSSRLFVVYGRSGFGKTSLLKAGLFPRLRERGLRPVYARTLQDPLNDLLAALAAEAGMPAPPADSPTDEALRSLLGKLPSTGRVVLVLDQFEEFFIRFRSRRDRREAFIAALRSLVLDPALDIHVVFSLREDYLAELDDFRPALPGLFDRAYRLLPLTAFGAREAITRPLIARGIPFSPTLVTKLVDALEQVGFEPPLLQIVCTEVYRQAIRRDPSAPALGDEDLRRVGNLQDIFRHYLDAVTRDPVIARDPLLARNIFDALLTREGTKRAVTLADLTAARFRVREDEVVEILEVLVRRYIVRREVRNDVPWFELIHENVVKSVKAWLDLDPDFVKFRSTRDLVVSVSRIGRSDGRNDVLLNKGQVEGMVGQFRSRFRFDADQAAYVFLSAVKSGSDHAGYWADQMASGAGASMLLEALDDHHPESREIRLGAATVAGVMTDPSGRIAEALAGLAHEPDEETRRAAARSYSRLRARYGPPKASPAPTKQPPASTAMFLLRLPDLEPGPPVAATPTPAPAGSGLRAWARRTFHPDVSVIYQAVLSVIRSLRERGLLESLRTLSKIARAGNPELDFLATRAEEGDPLLDQPYIKRLSARRLAEVRIRRYHAKSVRDHGGQGALAGVFAGLAWTLTLGASCYLLATDLGFSQGDESPAFSTSFALLMLAAAGFFGYATTSAVAIDALVRDDGFRPFRMARSRALLAAFCVTALSLAQYWTGLFPASSSTELYGNSNEYYTLLLFNLFVVSTLPSVGTWATRLTVSLCLLLLMSATAYATLSAVASDHGAGHLILYALKWLAFVTADLTMLALLFLAVEGLTLAIGRCTDRRPDTPRPVVLRSFLWLLPGAAGIPSLILAAVNIPYYIIFGRGSWPTVAAALAISALAFINVVARWYAWRAAPVPVKHPRIAPAPSPRARFFSLAALVAAAVVWGTFALFVHLTASPVAATATATGEAIAAPSSSLSSSPPPPAAAPLVEADSPLRPADHDSAHWVSAANSTMLRATANDKFNRRQWEEVVSDYRKALALADDGKAGDLAKLHGRLATALQRRGDLGAAITEARLALDLAPGSPDATNQLAWLLCLAGRYAEALPLARTLPNDKPDFLDTLAHASYGAGQWGQAVRAWNQVLRLNPRAFESPGDPNCAEDKAHYAAALKALDASFPADPFAPAR